MMTKPLGQKGLSLTEVLVAVALSMIIIQSGMMLLVSGQAAWNMTDTQIQLQEGVRNILWRVSKELRQSGEDVNDVLQVVINDGAGAGGSDILRFSIPLCICGNIALDTDGEVAYWGAPLIWGDNGCIDVVSVGANGKVDICHLPPGNPSNQQDLSVSTSALDAHLAHGDWLGACMTCSVTNNKYVEFQINNSGQFVRRVLSASFNTVKEDVVALNAQDFQVTLSADQNVVTLAFTMAGSTVKGRDLTISRSLNVFLRNK